MYLHHLIVSLESFRILFLKHYNSEPSVGNNQMYQFNVTETQSDVFRTTETQSDVFRTVLFT